MNSSELNASVTEAIVIFHHVSGVIFFLINMIVCFLIIFDVDPRGKVYRKYLLSLQLSSMMFDLLCNIYAPILLINSRLLYADSFLAQYIDMAVLGSTEVCIYVGVLNSYFACVYYRRCAVLPPGSRFCFVGWRRTFLFLSLQLNALVIAVVVIFLVTGSRATEQNVPIYLKWVTKKSSYIFVSEPTLLTIAAAIAAVYFICITSITVTMIGQVLIELKHGMRNASTATRRYQKRGAMSLVFQGVVPNTVYFIPGIVLISLYLNCMSMQLEEAASNQIFSAISSLTFVFFTTHTVAHSITVIAFSPAYRKTIRRVATNGFSRSTAAHRQSLPFLHSISKPFDRSIYLS